MIRAVALYRCASIFQASYQVGCVGQLHDLPQYEIQQRGNDDIDFNDSGDEMFVLQLMKLNEEWDQMYHNTTLGLQQQLERLELENATLKELNGKLLLRVENQQVNIYSNMEMLHVKIPNVSGSKVSWSRFLLTLD